MDKQTFTMEIQKALAVPFPESAIKFKPTQTTKGKNKEPIMRNGQQVAGCTAHIDARDVMNRLDDVVGVGGWSDDYREIANGNNVVCSLTVLGVTKTDVGEINDGGFADKMKSAYSDALKRAAIKFGIGRHLYSMEMQWLPFDGYRIIKPKTRTAPKPSTEDQHYDFVALMREVYGEMNTAKGMELVEWASGNRVTDYAKLHSNEIEKLITALNGKLDEDSEEN